MRPLRGRGTKKNSEPLSDERASDAIWGLDSDFDGPADPSAAAPTQTGMQRAAVKVLTAADGALGAMRRKREQRDRESELAELRQATLQSTPHIGGSSAALNEHLVPLSSKVDVHEFVSAERSASLFEKYHADLRGESLAAQAGLYLAVAFLVLLGFLGGTDYVSHLFAENVSVPQIVASNLEADQARGVVVVSGGLAPLLLFVLTSGAINEILRGALRRQVHDLIKGGVMGVGGLALLAGLVSGAYVTALVIGVVTFFASKVIAAVVEIVEGR
jgi:hypothetical protein